MCHQVVMTKLPRITYVSVLGIGVDYWRCRYNSVLYIYGYWYVRCKSNYLLVTWHMLITRTTLRFMCRLQASLHLICQDRFRAYQNLYQYFLGRPRQNHNSAYRTVRPKSEIMCWVSVGYRYSFPQIMPIVETVVFLSVWQYRYRINAC